MKITKTFKNSYGVIPLSFIFLAIGLLVFLLVASSFGFKDKLYSTLFPKPASEANENLPNR